ncbi:MAG: hypothetical protein V3W04_10145 [Gammaproteobacteria bacterium]
MFMNILSSMCRSHASFFIRKILWVFYLAVALVFVQGGRLHLHVYDHDPATSGHDHQEQAHFRYGISETGYPDEVAEVDLSQQGLLKSLSFGSLVIAFFVAVIVILLSRLLTRVSWLPDRYGPFTAWLYRLRPPLRAPPL